MESPVNTPQVKKPPVNKGGAKYKYTVDQVSELIDKYVAERISKELPPSQAGFAVYAHVDEDTITSWKDKEGYSEQVKKLTLASKAFTCDMLFKMKNPAGAIFYGKNYHDMSDKTTVEHTGNIIHSMQLEPGQAEAMLQRALEARERRLAPVIDGEVISAKTESIPVAIQVDAGETTD
jgi:preprotein translocase subunit SecD